MRLVDADKLENYAYEPEFGVKGEIENWIDETDIPWDIKTEYEEELRGLCWTRYYTQARMNLGGS